MSTKIALISLFVGLIWGIAICFFGAKFRGKELAITIIVGVVGWIAAAIAVWIMVGAKIAGWCWLTPVIAIVTVVAWYQLPERKTSEHQTQKESK